ncbi:MAG: ribonuclease P protein component [Clostridia bacterium]|nr:ribonuclease P protein component [Clostridia bacterium]
MDNRLKRRSDFDLVFKKGKRCYAKSLLLVYVKARDLKIGYSVSKKNGKAVIRNRIKRLLRACMREYTSSFKGGYYIVIVPKPSDDYSFKRYNEDIKYLLCKENLLND